MTQDEIMKMAKQAGFHIYNNCADGIVPDLERFAQLVAEKAVEREREQIIAITKTQEFSRMYGEFTPSAYDLVKAIRARGEA